MWRATINAPGARNYTEFFAFFNLDEKPVTLRATWKQLGLDGAKHVAQDLLDRRERQGVEGDDRDVAGARQRGLSSASEREHGQVVRN